MDSLKNDQHLIIRREAIQLLGIIGALDPFIHKQNLKQLNLKKQIQKKFEKNKNKLLNLKKAMDDDNNNNKDNNNNNNKPQPNFTLFQDEFYDEEESDFLSESNILLITGSRDPQFYAYVALRSLILIVHNESLHEYHRESLANISKIFSSLGSECIPYLQNVIPPILI